LVDRFNPKLTCFMSVCHASSRRQHHARPAPCGWVLQTFPRARSLVPGGGLSL